MAAVFFNLWNPYRADDGAFTFEITQADTFRIKSGSREFMDAALHALGIATDSYSWQITPGRSLYYSDYPNDADWRDRWTRTWRVQINPETPLPSRANALFRVPVDLTMNDNARLDLNEDEEEERYRHTAFVIVDFRKPREEIERVSQTLLASSGLRATPLEPAIRDFGNGTRQLQLLAREIDFPADTTGMEELLAGFKAAGGAVNWRSRLTWPAESSEELKPEIAAWLSSLGRLPKKE
jgi:hypothetical protein